MKTMDVAGRDAAILSAVEVGLGSVLHALHLPLSGQFLSLNQGFILCLSSRQTQGQKGSRYIGATVSSIAAFLKSLSPAGKKLTPMLAIGAQGCLFSLGTLVFGVNLIGLIVGMVLLSVWAFLQPMLIYYLLYGRTIIQVGEYFLEKLQSVFSFEPSQLLWVLGTIVTVKVFLAVGVALLAYRISDEASQAFFNKLLLAGRKKRQAVSQVQHQLSLGQKAGLALRDLFNPLFISSLVLTSIFFVFVHSDSTRMIWGLMRPVAVGFILFFVIRAVNFEALFKKLQHSPFKGYAAAIKSAVRQLKEL